MFDIESPTIVLVTGSRDATMMEHGNLVRRTLRSIEISGDVLLVHGGCKGIDLICEAVAREIGWNTKSMPADWTKGRAAGIIRNSEMIKEHPPNYVFGFPKGASPGTRDCLKKVHAHTNSPKHAVKVIITVELEK